MLQTDEKHWLYFPFASTFGWRCRSFYGTPPLVPWNLTGVLFHFSLDVSTILTWISLWKCKLAGFTGNFWQNHLQLRLFWAFAKNRQHFVCTYSKNIGLFWLKCCKNQIRAQCYVCALFSGLHRLPPGLLSAPSFTPRSPAGADICKARVLNGLSTTRMHETLPGPSYL